MQSDFPDDRAFAFTILDDTDDATLANVSPVYDLLSDLGMRTTKTAWPLSCPPERQGIFFAAETLQDPDYLAFVKGLDERGFEIAFHNATMCSSTREETVEALEFLRRELGRVPTLHCNHGMNRENLYWGWKRYRTRALRWLMRAVESHRGRPPYEGDDPSSPYFWGDVCRENFRFVRGFAFSRIDTRDLPPGRPYHDPSTPWVNYWFSTSDAPDVHAFKHLVTREAVDRLEERRGVCILSTHLGKGFVRDGRVDPEVETILRYIASKRGWFVPASMILEHQLETVPGTSIGWLDRLRLETLHVLDRVAGRKEGAGGRRERREP